MQPEQIRSCLNFCDWQCRRNSKDLIYYNRTHILSNNNTTILRIACGCLTQCCISISDGMSTNNVFSFLLIPALSMMELNYFPVWTGMFYLCLGSAAQNKIMSTKKIFIPCSVDRGVTPWEPSTGVTTQKTTDLHFHRRENHKLSHNSPLSSHYSRTSPH
jgi:hypothetical protein